MPIFNTDTKKMLVILDCCEDRFSKIIDFSFNRRAEIGESITISVQGVNLTSKIQQFFPAYSEANPYCLDVIFLKSNNDDLWETLVESVGENDGWSERESAINKIPVR